MCSGSSHRNKAFSRNPLVDSIRRNNVSVLELAGEVLYVFLEYTENLLLHGGGETKYIDRKSLGKTAFSRISLGPETKIDFTFGEEAHMATAQSPQRCFQLNSGLDQVSIPRARTHDVGQGGNCDR